MKLTEKIFKLFSTEYSLVETEYQDRYEAKCRTNTFMLPKADALMEALRDIPERDAFVFRVHHLGKTTTLNLGQNYDDFISKLSDEIDLDSEKTDDDDYIELILDITKNINNNILSIYSLDSFEEYILSLNLEDLANVISICKKNNWILFHLQENIDYELKSARIIFSKSCNTFDFPTENKISRMADVCNFQNSSKYRFYPDDFHIGTKPRRAINEVFDKLKILFSIVYLSDSSIISENTLSGHINGYRRFDFSLDFRNIDLSKNLFSYNIYKWVYEDGDLYDKVGLARNIISLSCTNGILDLNDVTFKSILSNYKIYLKNNVSRYIEVKNTISEQLLSLSQRSHSTLNDFLSSFKQNFVAFITFFISVIILQTISTGKLNNIFTKDIAIISYALIAISLAYLVATFFNFKFNLLRADSEYASLKNRYVDLLEKEDIERIFSKDIDHDLLMRGLNNQAKKFSYAWLFSLVVLLISVFVLTIKVNQPPAIETGLTKPNNLTAQATEVGVSQMHVNSPDIVTESKAKISSEVALKNDIEDLSKIDGSPSTAPLKNHPFQSKK